MATSDREVIAKGWTSTIYAGGDIDFDKVIKVVDRAVNREPTVENIRPLFEAERNAYERLSNRKLGSVPILDYHGVDANSQFGLILSRVENGDLYTYLHHIHINQPKDKILLLRWAKQAATGLAFCHEHDVLHCDIHTANCFLDKNLDLKIGDFGAASVAGSNPKLMYRTTHQLWIADGEGGSKKDISVMSEIFALGCVFYEIEARKDAFSDLPDDLIKEKLKQRQMPHLDDLTVLRTIILKCWKLKYESMRDVVADIDALTEA